MERTALIAARIRKHWTQLQAATRIGVDWNTLSRWERGVAHPRAYYIDSICTVYEMTAVELGLIDVVPFLSNASIVGESDDPLRMLTHSDLSQRFMAILVSWPFHKLRAHEVQAQVMQATEEHTRMNPQEEISRREALRRLALLPIDVYGFSAAGAALTGPFEEIITHCAAGLTACWYLCRGKELHLASMVVSAYIPTLQTMMNKAHTTRLRQGLAELLVQCFVLKAMLARHIEGNIAAITYAKRAVYYSEQINDKTMHVLALRELATAYSYTDNWDAALVTSEQAQFLLERSSSATIPKLAQSYVYAGLANYQAHQGKKQPSLASLQKAHEMFFAEPDQQQNTVWINHSQANLWLNDGMAHFHLGLQREALESFQKIDTLPAKSELIRVETLIDAVLAELQREDAPQNMEWCIDRWQAGITGAKALQSEQRFGEALTAYTVLRSVWPKEQRVKELRELAVHW